MLLALHDVIRLRTLVPADVRMKGRECVFRPLEGDCIRLSGDYFSGAREMYCRGVYFFVPGFEVERDDTVVDLGANVGLFSTMAAVYGRHVLAVEAQSGFIPLIEANLGKNGCRKKAAIRLALVGSGTGALSVPERQATASHWVTPPPCLSMGELLAQAGITRINLLKIDIEGSEFDLLSDELTWLASVDRIAMEVHGTYGDVGSLQATLQKAGFRVALVNSEGHSVDSLERDGYLFARSV